MADSVEIPATVVGADGATLEGEAVTLSFGAGALDSEVSISVARLGSAASARLPAPVDPQDPALQLMSPTFAFRPHGTIFAQAVPVEIRHAEGGSAIMRLDDENDDTWEWVASVEDDGVASFDIYGFSIYGVVGYGPGTAGPSKRSAENVNWTRQFGIDEADEVTALAVAPDDSAVVVGLTHGAFPGFKQGGNGDAFVRKYDTNGNEVWTRQFGFGSTEHAKAVTIDATGTIFVAGEALHLLDEADVDFELVGDVFFRRAGGAFVRAYGGNGDLQWSFQLWTSGGNTSEITTITVSGEHLIIAGQQNAGELFVRKIDHAGNTLWGDAIDAPEGSDSACGVAVDSEGNTLLLGQLNGAVAGLSSHGGAVVRKYDPHGATLWTQVFEDSGCAVNSGSLRVDAEGLAYVVTGAEIRKLDANGDVLWEKNIYPVQLSSAALVPGALLVAGYTPDIPASEGNSWDITVRKYDLNGVEAWTRQVGSPGQDNPYALDVDSGGRIYLGGRSITPNGTLSGITDPASTGAFLMQMQP